MHADLLIAEIGSTTTLVTAFSGLAEGRPVEIGQGQTETTVLQGDVTIGLEKAVADMRAKAGQEITWKDMVASSSAAGGLRMSVHGLAYDMTVRAAKEAALGAGANIKMITAGELSEYDIEEIKKLVPNIILLAGGVDYGEKKTVIGNARLLAASGLKIPVIFAGNCTAKPEVERILTDAGITVFAVENVYPKIDNLNVEPTRAVIQDVFEKHITEAPGMKKIRDMVTGRIIPTPGAVMLGAKLLQMAIGDLVAIDVGGATTDVHSVTEGSSEYTSKAMEPEPFAKRTVEGDLGVFVSAPQVLALCDTAKLAVRMECDADNLLDYSRPIPTGAKEIMFSEELASVAANVAMNRHAGRLEYIYGPSGRMTITKGKDLTAVKWIIGTGGALTRLPAGRRILEALNHKEDSPQLFPRNGEVLLDNNYIMAAAGLMGGEYPEAALALMRESMNIPASAWNREPGD